MRWACGERELGLAGFVSGEDTVEVAAREGPLERFGDRAVLLTEAEQSGAVHRHIDPVLFFFSVVGMCEFVFTAQPWLTYGFGAALDDDLVERYADHVSELVLASIGTPLGDGNRSTE